ncbi:hypothetical protein RGQ30_00060 [Limnobacter thiooxidans]|uniref:Uncharacterized protein n=1 Tax=Limnobacter thiooxidans TaxID=131080 RepID=A0AA86MDD9_9BURK|nr:hypothetical protein RGQ30_00060 [Limnobacter thiooxidans]
MFGKTVREDENRNVSHVHLYPQNDEDSKQKWATRWSSPHSNIRNSRVSDRYLFYVEHPIHGYHLLLHVVDPGAHVFRHTPKGKVILKLMFEKADTFEMQGKS